ncbi:MazF family toxin-antitoxin system [Lactobacillus sp. PV037]|uniref:MazF family toxin-antitoxin system n=1 Tax=Lactobacillus sp. PV037 TaxID=2594496 RepID=UPI00223F06DF|nr:MazF family toxin-antitoxin system [Lactobacillus sp. PV037]QNQ83701.1 MazF family toxin-antitoxin system [Lactobacillus sp. PV037]
MKSNEIYIAYVSWKNDGKHRPVLIVKVNKKEVRVFKITTQYENKSQFIKEKYYKIQDLVSAGLVKQSYIDTGETYTLNSDKIKFKKIGTLGLVDILGLDKFINRRYKKRYKKE